MSSLIVPSHVAKKRRVELAEKIALSPRKGLGRAVHTVDPRQKIYLQVGMVFDAAGGAGRIPGYEIFGNRVLIGVYERPDRLASGLYLADRTRREDEHQGRAGLVLLLGWSAFRSDGDFDFGPDKIVQGDWIEMTVQDGRKSVVNGQLCRIMRDQDIIGKIPHPDAIY